MKKNRMKYLVSYTILFAVILAAVSSWLLMEGRSLVLGGDPVAQHVRALIYYARWLRALPGYLLREHTLPAYSLSIGYGSDVITTLHFYVAGDPLNLLSAFVPTKYMSVFYSVMIVVRMYLAGLSFSYMCRSLREMAAADLQACSAGEKADEKRAGILAGTLTYVFCAFTIFGGWRHPFFLNPMIYFPLIITGAEKIRLKKKHLLFTLAVALSACSNFYFFYMIAVLTVVYAVWKCVCIYGKDIRESLIWILHLGGSALTGVLMAGFMLVPVLYAFAGNPRSVEGYIYDALFKADYYLKLPGSLITFWSAGEWGYIGISSAALLAILALFVTGKRRDLQILFGLGLAALCVPAVNYALNGFSYVSERWVWGFVCLCAYMVYQGWEQIGRLMYAAAGADGADRSAGVKRRAQRGLRRWGVCAGLLLSGLLALSCTGAGAQSRMNLRIQLVLMAAGLGLVLWQVGKKRAYPLAGLFVCLILGICCNGQFGIIPALGGVGNGYYQWKRVAGETAEIFDTESAVIRTIRENEGEAGLFRYSGTGLSGNSSVQDGLPSTQFYWSLANGYVNRFFDKLGLCTSYASAYANLDDRTILNEIAGVRDFYTQEAEHVPYGYDLLDQAQNPYGEQYPVYRNRFALPFGITYAHTISGEAFDALDPGARGEVMLQWAVVEDDPDGHEGSRPEEDQQDGDQGEDMQEDGSIADHLTRLAPDMQLEAVGGQAVIDGNTVTALADGAKIRIRFEGSENSESYLYLGGIGFTDEAGSLRDIPERLNFRLSAYAGKKKLMTRTVSWFTRREKWYAGRNSFMIPAGFHDEKLTTLRLTLPAKGIYTFDEMAVYVQPLDERYETLAERLREETPENIDLHTGLDAGNWATGRIDLDMNLSGDRLLCLQMACSKGWKAWVDGERVPVIRANLMFTGLRLSQGDHHIVLRYATPGLPAGVCCSVLGIGIVIFCTVYKRRRKSL